MKPRNWSVAEILLVLVVLSPAVQTQGLEGLSVGTVDSFFDISYEIDNTTLPDPADEGKDECNNRPWMRTLQETFVGTVELVDQEAELPLLTEDELQPDDCNRTTTKLQNSWVRVDIPTKSMYEVNMDDNALRDLERLEDRFPAGASGSPDVLPVPTPSELRSRKWVFGSDNRWAIPCGYEYSFPSRVIGKVSSGCTGTLIGPRHVLTAGHCVHSGGTGGHWYGPLTFQPHLNCNPATHTPPPKYNVVWMITVKGWTVHRNFHYDYALLFLNTSPGVGWMSFGYHSGINFWWNFNFRGYMSQDRPYYQMYNSFQTGLKWVESTRLLHTVDIVKGSSGGPMFIYKSANNFFRVYGIQSHHACPSGSVSGTKCNSWWGYNGATRITSSRFHQICGWMNVPYVC